MNEIRANRQPGEKALSHDGVRTWKILRPVRKHYRFG